MSLLFSTCKVYVRILAKEVREELKTITVTKFGSDWRACHDKNEGETRFRMHSLSSNIRDLKIFNVYYLLIILCL